MEKLGINNYVFNSSIWELLSLTGLREKTFLTIVKYILCYKILKSLKENVETKLLPLLISKVKTAR